METIGSETCRDPKNRSGNLSHINFDLPILEVAVPKWLKPITQCISDSTACTFNIFSIEIGFYIFCTCMCKNMQYLSIYLLNRQWCCSDNLLFCYAACSPSHEVCQV